jgi:uncharacterized protein with von Willebrand factor type A (vWA) domain
MTSDDLIVHLARFAGELREHGVDVGIGDEVDATKALTLIDLFDRAEVRRAFQIAFKIRPRDRAVFDTLFDRFWSTRGPDGPAEAGPHDRFDKARAERRASTRRDPMPRRHAVALAASGSDGESAGDGSIPGYSRDVILRRKPFEECSAGDLADMERLLARLAPHWAARKSRRLVPVRGRGLPDLRRDGLAGTPRPRA